MGSGGAQGSATFVCVGDESHASKITDDLASHMSANEDALVEVVVELHVAEEDADAPAPTDRQAKILAKKEGFRATAEPVVTAIRSCGGEVTGEAWINQTLRARVPARSVERLAEEEAVARVDVPHEIEPERT